MNPKPTPTCEICHLAFTPDPRVGERQRACRKLSCQLQRKRRTQKNWLAKNPKAFRDRYPKLKQWLAQHPGYLKNYRARQKRLGPFPPGDIQDELSPYSNRSLTHLRQILAMQDEITAKITMCKRRLSGLIYKTSLLSETLSFNSA